MNAILLFLIIAQHIFDPRYHSTTQVIQTLNNIVLVNPNILRLDTLGFTEVFELPVLCLKISDNVLRTEPEPKVLLTGVHHAEEVMGAEVLLSLIDTVVRSYGTDSLITQLVNELEIYVIPVLNPDGHMIVTTAQDTSWRKNLHDNDMDGHIDIEDRTDGVDLNRNYDFKWEYGNDNPASSYYRGPYPFSEPETKAIRELTLKYRFTTAIHYHSPAISFGEIVYTPYIGAPEFDQIFWWGQKLAQGIQRVDGSGHYGILYGEINIPNARNWMYSKVGTFAFNIEIGSLITQPSPDSLHLYVRPNLEGLLNYLSLVLNGPGLGITVRDAKTNKPLIAKVYIPSIDSLGTTLDRHITDSETGFTYRLLLPGSYEFVIESEDYFPETLEVAIAEKPVYREVYLKSLNEVWVTPTFVGDLMGIRFYSIKDETGEISIFEPTGRLVMSNVVSFKEGVNLVKFKLSNRLPVGLYFLVLKASNGFKSTKFIRLGG